MILILVVLALVSNLSHGKNCRALLFHFRNYPQDGNTMKCVYLYNFRLGAEIEDTLDKLHLKNVIQTDPEYYSFWKRYSENFLNELLSNNHDMASEQLIQFTKEKTIPSYAFCSKMPGEDESNREAYGRCVLYSTCTGKANIGIDHAIVVKDKHCLTTKERKNQESCAASKLTLFEV